VVSIHAAYKRDVQRQCGRGCERAPELLDELRVEWRIAQNFLTWEFNFVDKEWTARKVESDIDESFVKGNAVRSEATNTGFVAERYRKGLTKSDTDIFNGVMRVDLQIALGPNDEIEATVTTKLRKHVIEEREAGRGLVATLTIEIDLDQD